MAPTLFNPVAKKWWQMVGKSDEDWPTFVRAVGDKGRLVGVGAGKNGTGGQTWLYGAVPMVAMDDARDGVDVERGTGILEEIYEELSNLASALPGGRALSAGTYREFHYYGVSLPRPFSPPAGHPLAEDLSHDFPDLLVPTRVALFGVRLIPSMAMRGSLLDKAKQMAASAVDAFASTEETPQSDFDDDAELISSIFTRAGLTVPTVDQFMMADSWWSFGTGQPATFTQHSDHLHVFRFAGDAKKAYKLDKKAKDLDGRECDDWGGRFDDFGVTVAAGSSTSFEGVTSLSQAARWAGTLLRTKGVVVSVRGFVEPAKVTQAEAKKLRDKYKNDIAHLRKKGKEVRGSTQDRFADQAWFFDMYERADTGAVCPTAHSTSVVVVLDGTDPKVADTESRKLAVKLAPMDDQQFPGMVETLMCSPVRANPVKFDWPTAAVVASCGINDLSTAGDPPLLSVLGGFTEHDGQPVWTNAHQSTGVENKPPIEIEIGETGSGKTQHMLYRWKQNGRVRLANDRIKKSVFVNPKEQVLGHVAEFYGGRTFLLDDMLTSDGALDALGFFSDSQLGFDQALSNCMSIAPGTPDQQRAAELPLQTALRFGITNGATATGQALSMWLAWARGVDTSRMLDEERRRHETDIAIVDEFLRVPRDNPRARSLVGTGKGQSGFDLSEGLTMIEATGGLALPSSVPDDPSTLYLPDRISLAILRNIVYACLHALANQDAVLYLDEGWVFMVGAKQEMERLGKIARSLDVPVTLADQNMLRVVDLADYISQGWIFNLRGAPEKNAMPAFTMFGVDPDYGGKWRRVVAEPKLPGYSAADGSGTSTSVFNYSSLRPLTVQDQNGKTVEVLRGSVAYYIDLHGHCLPVEIKLPREFLEIASTNPQDIRARLAKMSQM